MFTLPRLFESGPVIVFQAKTGSLSLGRELGQIVAYMVAAQQHCVSLGRQKAMAVCGVSYG